MRTLPLVLLVACGDAGPVGLDLLGGGSHTPDAVTIEVVADAASGLNSPTDIAVNPRSPGQWFITNFADNSVVRIHDGVYEGKYSEPGSEHFLASPSSLAFSDFGNFATSQDTDEVTQPSTPADFMGPTLWDDSASFDGGHGGHLDMLHNSPNGGGIAWESGNVYWVVDGAHGSLTRYDFGSDHGYGGADHSDGVIDRYAEGLVGHSRGTPSHVDMFDGVLYVSDGTGRVFSFDPSGAVREGTVGPNYDGAVMSGYVGGAETTLATGQIPSLLDERGDETVTPYTLSVPSGLEVHEGLLYLTDRPTGVIFAMTLDGELVDWVPTGRPNALAGLDFDADGNLLVVDQTAHELLRISAAAE
ncbi:MAG: hypothetical protein EP330_09880 [Deltaproteobacteria bacterium]|nr:MAG: hypothetical protein EP330_09880 [Deltaproteobacteria bacterium]